MTASPWRQTPPRRLSSSRPRHTGDEGGVSVAITVTRTGSAAQPATVDYATSDQSPLVNCATVTNLASARCDYSMTVDTLRFETNEVTKTLTVPIIDDGLQEGAENFNIALANPTGATLGAQTSAMLTITDNDSASAASNSIDSTPFFVRVQYLDFLSREPESDGFNAWANLLNGCSDVNNDPRCDRIAVSTSFFGSQEFQLKGYFVYRFYQVSFGRLPLYNEITADMRAVTGQTGDEVVQKKSAFTDAWVTKIDFQQSYPSSLNPQAFVDQLERTAEVALANKAQLVSDLTSGAKTRAQVVRAVVESAEVDVKFYNEAFVAMQYFGYLKRDPEPDGFNAWLRVINANPSGARTMVDGFMNSVEYRGRFGKP
ncbi:MAG: Calx-beta domain-containing protein [Pyrinomonadaceae bacterium]